MKMSEFLGHKDIEQLYSNGDKSIKLNETTEQSDQIELKEPKTFQQQIDILKERDMIIEDETFAANVLKSTNYYRITAYALQFKIDNKYVKGITFNNIYRLYKFDDKLKHIILEILESIEIATRTYLAYSLSIRYGPEAYKNELIYEDETKLNGDGGKIKGLLGEIDIELRKNKKEAFVKHHNQKYNGRYPIWVIVEVLSFGMLSKMYENLKITEKKEISKNAFNINYSLLESWLKNFSYIRNICAHYGRLYNKSMTTTPKIHNNYKGYTLDTNKIFVSILAIRELMKDTEEWRRFLEDLNKLIKEYDDIVDLSLIGFPDNWHEILTSTTHQKIHK